MYLRTVVYAFKGEYYRLFSIYLRILQLFDCVIQIWYFYIQYDIKIYI